MVKGLQVVNGLFICSKGYAFAGGKQGLHLQAVNAGSAFAGGKGLHVVKGLYLQVIKGPHFPLVKRPAYVVKGMHIGYAYVVNKGSAISSKGSALQVVKGLHLQAVKGLHL